jgi:anti-sigma regulatory factor (Ser/Thr protein kinase)
LLHGNLELSSDQLHAVQFDDPDLVRRRAAELPYTDRRIHLYAEFSADMARFIIRDDGPGFSYAEQIGSVASDDSEGGRGLVLMRAFMDDVAFNAAGNEVTMSKYRPQENRSSR